MKTVELTDYQIGLQRINKKYFDVVFNEMSEEVIKQAWKIWIQELKELDKLVVGNK